MLWLPFDLHPEYPPEGVPRTVLQRRYGEGFLDHVRRMIEASGFEHAPPAVAPRSRGALELAELARAEGCHEAVHGALFRAYWSDGRDIGDREVLLGIAEVAGLDPRQARHALETGVFGEAVKESTELAHEVGVDAVPAWLVDDKILVLGAQPHEAFEEVLRDLGHEPVVGASTA